MTSIDLEDASTSKVDVYKGSTSTNGSCRIIRSFKYLQKVKIVIQYKLVKWYETNDLTKYKMIALHDIELNKYDFGLED